MLRSYEMMRTSTPSFSMENQEKILTIGNTFNMINLLLGAPILYNLKPPPPFELAMALALGYYKRKSFVQIMQIQDTYLHTYSFCDLAAMAWIVMMTTMIKWIENLEDFSLNLYLRKDEGSVICCEEVWSLHMLYIPMMYINVLLQVYKGLFTYLIFRKTWYLGCRHHHVLPGINHKYIAIQSLI